MVKWTIARWAFFTLLAMASHAHLSAQTLEESLIAESVAALVADAESQGDARRGAILFHQGYLSCTKCHMANAGQTQLGPKISEIGAKTPKSHIVESLLLPSKTIKKGYEGTAVVTTDGEITIGLIVTQSSDELRVRRPASGIVDTFKKTDIEEFRTIEASVMPSGLMNLLSGRQQFLDLCRYLFEVADGGAKRESELKPAASLYALKIPEYENDIDHAGMISTLDDESFERGSQIYNRLCINCHGTEDRPGSLPTSLPFATGKFKNGSDPLSMYQTLTRGYGMMVAQSWMVPQQKYDVIHYIREHFLKQHNESQYVNVDEAYLTGLPTGSSRGPAPSNIEPWSQMDYGPSLVNTYEVGKDGSNFAYKGIAVRLDPGPGGVAHGNTWLIFDHDTMRLAAAWTGDGFVDWNGIHFNGRHGAHPHIVGDVAFQNPTGPGWARPGTDDFSDNRLIGRDKRRYGPLDRNWAHYKGFYRHPDRTVIKYTVGQTQVLESFGSRDFDSQTVFVRDVELAPNSQPLNLLLATERAEVSLIDDARRSVSDAAEVSAVALGRNETEEALAVAAIGDVAGLVWHVNSAGQIYYEFPKGDETRRIQIQQSRLKNKSEFDAFVSSAADTYIPVQLADYMKGGSSRYPERIETQPIMGNDDGPFAVDVLIHPEENPWFCRTRLTGLDYFADANQAIVSAWDGNIWHVTGLNQPQDGLVWRRIADGLFQPLGVKIVNETIYVTCRDQIVILNDLNGDGETDYYESFNSDHQVTEHFHEFAMGLQVDEAGNFYYAKSARHALPALVPHHGTLLRVSKDGSRTDILAKGFRAANGVCLNPDGSFIVTDQEGHWNPKNRINWVREGGFYGNMMGYHDVTDSADSAMQQPLCWITNSFDRSPSELLWANSKAWGPIEGTLLNLSYGYGKVYVVPHEEIAGQMQGGMCQIPIDQFPTGVMRGRFHPENGQLYCCGMFAWAGTQHKPGGFYRIRYTGKPVHLPVGLSALKTGMQITFSGELDNKSATDVSNYKVKTWDLKRTKNYGSDHYNERPLLIESATLSADHKTVFLKLPDIAPTWCMEIQYDVLGKGGETVRNKIHNTIHNLRNE